MMNTENSDISASFSFSPALRAAYGECERLARTHYENFPVASILLPRKHRPAVAAIYAFARTADDLADEGSVPPSQRLQALDDWEQLLRQSLTGSPEHPVFLALADTMRRYSIPLQLLLDLLAAFRQDVVRNRYCTFDELLHYCRNSANPVGRLVLHIFGLSTPERCSWSDDICTALQLTNFWQDLGIDLHKGRIYLPLEDLERFQYTEQALLERQETSRFRELMEFQVRRTRSLFAGGFPLLASTRGRLRLELTATWHGGSRILDSIERMDYRVLSTRPALRWTDIMAVFWNSLRS